MVRYIVRDEVLLALEEAGQAFRFLPVTKLWHLERAVAAVAAGARAVGPEEAGRLVGQLRAPYGKTRAAKESKAQAWEQIARVGEVLTTAEVGLTAAQVPGHRPITAPGLEALLVARGSVWTGIVRYGADTDRTSHYHVRTGYEETTRFCFPIDAQINDDESAGQRVIEIRRRPAERYEA